VEHGSVSNDCRERLGRFVDLLTKWNASVNLSARGDLPAIWARHIADSLQLAPLLLPRPERAIDLGSGGGFPGLILAVATGIPFDLIEADQRKAAFLREAARVVAAPATIHARRIEEAPVARASVVTARALAPLPKLLDLAAPKLDPGGYCLFLKGRTSKAELTAAAAGWHMRVEQFPSTTDPSATILRVSEISRVAHH
jgi:16S rRNA (guanine527-N7)-methyltransferase